MPEIFRTFFNTLTRDDKYSIGNRENLGQPIQMRLSKKLEISSQLFTAFLKSTFNFVHVEQKDEPHTACICQIIDRERRGFFTV